MTHRLYRITQFISHLYSSFPTVEIYIVGCISNLFIKSYRLFPAIHDLYLDLNNGIKHIIMFLVCYFFLC